MPKSSTCACAKKRRGLRRDSTQHPLAADEAEGHREATDHTDNDDHNVKLEDRKAKLHGRNEKGVYTGERHDVARRRIPHNTPMLPPYTT